MKFYGMLTGSVLLEPSIHGGRNKTDVILLTAFGINDVFNVVCIVDL